MERLDRSFDCAIVEQNTTTLGVKDLTEEDRLRLEKQDSRLISEFNAMKLEKDCKRNWDLFYKRNTTNFFKDRNWTTREFEELLGVDENDSSGNVPTRRMLEVGCGVGNLVYPLLDNPNISLFIYACDFSSRAVEFLRENPKFDCQRMKAFQCDITDADQFREHIPEASLDIITMIFVLSAISPQKFTQVVRNLKSLLKPDGILLFRDYGRYDMAQLRFKAGSKIADNLYVRQDGTRSYFFTMEEVAELFREDFDILTNVYVNRRTINPKENLNVARTFIQGKFVRKK